MKQLAILIAVLGASSCPKGSAPMDPTDPPPLVPIEIEDEEHASVPQPWPTEPNSVTQDVDADLVAVLERDALEGACEAYRAGDNRRETRLRCGKWMFFYESFGTVGVPSHLLELFQTWFKPYFGPSFSKFGFVPDPHTEEPIPLGLAQSSQRMGEMNTHAFTCASCHFGQLPDGRYAVGHANHRLDYGRFFAAMVALLKLGLNPEDAGVHPELREALGPEVEQARQQPGFFIAIGSLGLNVATRGGDFLSEGGIDLSPEEQLRFWRLRTGTMDFLTKPMVDDGVWTVSRILNLWNLPDEDRISAADMPHALLSWTGIGESLMDFLHGFVAISGSSEDWDDEALEPLAEYIYSLRAPTPLSSQNPQAIDRGARIFAQAGCLECHDGPSGEGRELYGFDTIGTDSAMRSIYSPDPEGKLCCGLDFGGERATGQIKSPRLAGQRYRTRLLHNGSLDGLSQLLCLEDRPNSYSVAQSSAGHRFGCDELTAPEKRDLIEYLEHL